MKIVGFILVENMTTVYRGVDRDPWSSLAASFYQRQLVPELALIYERIRASNDEYAGIPVARANGDCQAVATWMESESIPCEALAIWSDELEHRQGSFEAQNCQFEKLGDDVVALGEWSLVQAGLFGSPVLEQWRTRLNAQGLFDDVSPATEFIDDYMQAMAEGHLEQLALGPYFPIDVVEVYSVTWT